MRRRSALLIIVGAALFVGALAAIVLDVSSSRSDMFLALEMVAILMIVAGVTDSQSSS